jgi:twinkle protein
MRDEYNEQKNFIDSLCGFADRLKCHVHVVAHPRKTQSDEDSPGKVDVKGNSHITDLADNVIVLNRTSDEAREESIKRGRETSDMQVYIKKNREFGIEGRIHFWFNERTKCYSDRKEFT